MNIKIRKKGSYPDAMIASVLAVLFSHKFPRAKKPYLEKDVCVCMCMRSHRMMKKRYF
jgi:hypothetical protein